MKTKGKFFTALFMISAALLLSGCSNDKMPSEMQTAFEKYITYWNTGQLDDIDKYVAPGYELYESPGFEPRHGIDFFEKYIANTRVTYPDFKITVNEVLFDKERIAYIWTVTGTNLGTGEIPPTGRTINGKGMSILHFTDGKIKDEWRSNNNLQWLMQLGFTINPPAAESPVPEK
ncbi:MAG: ester cyclase [Bacteroidales bacterium]|nr:ester cyclase [Bacteroidales bacterium]